MWNSTQNDDEIIILSDDDDFSTWLELEELAEQDQVEIDFDAENKLDLSLANDVSDIEKNDDNDIVFDLEKPKSWDNIDLQVEPDSKIEASKEESLAFDFGWSTEEVKISEEWTKWLKSLDLILESTVLELKDRKSILSTDKSNNLEEERFRNSEIKRLEWEIKWLKDERDTIETEIKQIDENVISLWKMKIPNTPKTTTKK